MEFSDDDEENKKDISKNNKKEESKKDEKEETEKSNSDSKSSIKIKGFMRMKTKTLSSFPELISIKESPQSTDNIEEKKDFDRKLWIPDEDAQNCYNCGSKFFSLFNRKHHCRVCGNIFCKSCLESFYEITIYNEKQELKVCGYCLEKKLELNNRLKNNLVECFDEKGKNSKVFKTKTWEYINVKSKNREKIDNFCGFKDYQSIELKNFHDNLDENYIELLEKMINKILTEKSDKIKFPNLSQDWNKCIFKLTQDVINNLSPTFQNLNDSININDYIKIKTIETRNNEKTGEVIDGYAMKKNVVVKSMRTDIDNPSILILQGSLEHFRNRLKPNTKNNIIIKSSAVEAYIEIIRKKIEGVSPNIILVEGNVLPQFQSFFAKDKMNISLITKVDIKKLNKIARCVNTIVVPSPDLIGRHIVLGSCKKFRIQEVKANYVVENRNNILNLKGDYHLMRFEGCGEKLFNTIILCGPNKEELKELKRLMKIITRTARYLYCQKFLLKYFNMVYEPSLGNILNEQNEIKKAKNKRKGSIYKENDYSFGFDTDIIDEKNNEFDCIYLYLQNKNKSDTLNTSLSIMKMPANTISELDKNNSLNNSINPVSLKESQVLKSTPNQCASCSYTMNAYSVENGEEKTLGQNIISFLEEAKERCDKCGDSKLNHTSFIYKNNGRIKISILNLNEQIYYIDKIAEYLGLYTINSNKKKESSEDEEIYSYGYCDLCNQIVTPIIILPEEILNFSATKFYQNILYNKKVINFGDKDINILNFDTDLIYNENAAYNCSKAKHLHYRDISRIFMTKNGVVKFKYEEIIKYKLLGSQLNTKADSDIEDNKQKKINEIASDKIISLNALESLKNKFIVHKNILDSLKTECFSELINKIKKIIEDGIERIEELKKKNDQIFEDESEYENIFVYNTHLRKYLLKIMNIKIISNKLLKGIKRIIKLIFFEEVDEINKNEQEVKEIELLPKSGQDVGLKISKSISENNKNIKENELINKEKLIGQEDGNQSIKEDLILKNKSSSIPLISDNTSNIIRNNNNINNNNNTNNINNTNNNNNTESKLNLSNSSSISDFEENEEENNENNKGDNDSLNFEESGKRLDKINSNEAEENNIKTEEKEKPKEESNKPPELSLKKSMFSSFFNANPEVKEKINKKYNACVNEMNKYVNNILELEKNEFISRIISQLNYYDKNHSVYSAEVNDDDICSLITYALTSDQYLESVKIDNKNSLNEIKSQFTKNVNNNDDDNDIFCQTSLLYDIDKVKFSLGNLSNEKISQILKNELINNENKKCIYELKYNPSQVFNEVFEKKAKKANKTSTNSKINYTDLNQKLYQMNSELKNIKSEIKKLYKEKFDEIKKRFDFPKYELFEEDKIPTTEIKITIFYTKHFESFRILYGASYFNFLHSIIKSQEWSSVTGGKSKAHFFKSWDEKFVVKCLSELEFNMFINSCFHYFVHNNKYFFFKMPSSLVKVVGAYRIKISSTTNNVIYCVMMQHLNYLLKAKNTSIITYDLKGSEINRYIKNKENSRVLMDTNFVEDFGGEPLPLDQKIYTLFLCSISNDTKICRNMEVIDYSLLCIIIDYKEDENNEDDKKNNYLKKIYNKGDNEGNVKFIRLGVLDYFRKYTSDKQLETLVKTIMNKFNTPTVINPKKYDERFFKKLSSYFIGS